MGVKTMEQNRKPQKPMRRSRPRIPAIRHRAKYATISSRIISTQAGDPTSLLSSLFIAAAKEMCRLASAHVPAQLIQSRLRACNCPGGYLSIDIR